MYSNDLKMRVIEYRQKGHTLRKTAEVFKIAKTTVDRWVKTFEATGKILDKYDVSNRKYKKIEPEAFKKYVETHNDAFQKEIAEHFGCAKSSVWKALKKYKFTLKKRRIFTKNEVKKNAQNLSKK
jgi:transposase